MKIPSRSRLTIDRDALAHNLASIKRAYPRNRVLAVVKNEAYGHGLSMVLPALEAADGFGVVTIEEALMVRQHHPDKPVVLMQGIFTDEERVLCQQHQLTTVIHDAWQAQHLSAARQPIHVWLKVNIGMNRLGFAPHDIEAIWQQSKPWCVDHENRVLMGHFPSAHADDVSISQQQAELFKSCANQLGEPTCSLSNSAAMVRQLGCEHTWLRPGLLLYGLMPCTGPLALDLRPAMTFSSQLISVRRCRAGDTVSYGGLWQCPEDMPVGIVACGYASGLPLDLPVSLPVEINGVLTRSIGKITMSMLAIDLRSVPRPQVGDWVTLWGERPSARAVAACYQADPRALLCHGCVLLHSADVMVQGQ